jgi:hypothetical protein
MRQLDTYWDGKALLAVAVHRPEEKDFRHIDYLETD